MQKPEGLQEKERLYLVMRDSARTSEKNRSRDHSFGFWVNGKSLKMAATLGHNIKCVERER